MMLEPEGPHGLALRLDGPPQGGTTLLLAHGAGAPMDSPWMQELAAALADQGLRTARFEFPYMAERRRSGRKRPPDRPPVLLSCFREVVTAIGEPAKLVIGGKSLGGRIASMVADELGVRALVCFGYPFHPPGRPDKLRTAHLQNLTTPALFVQGERDPFGRRDEVESYRLSDRIRFCWLPEGDHSLAPRKSSGRTLADHLELAATAVAEFLSA